MLQVHTCVSVHCDQCGHILGRPEHTLHFRTEGAAINAAIADRWRIAPDGQWWCALCAPALICRTDEFRSEGHCVRPVGPGAFADTGATYTIYVANPNSPGRGPDEPSNQIIIDKATNTYRLMVWPGGPIWTGGAFTGGILSWVPFSVLCRQPRTPFWEAVALALGAGLLFLGEGASTQQITDGGGHTLYKAGRTGNAARWDELNMDASAIPGLVPVPLFHGFLSRGPMFDPKNGALGMSAQGHAPQASTGPELYRLAGQPSPFGPAPTHSARPPSPTARHFPIAPAPSLHPGAAHGGPDRRPGRG